MGLAIVRAELRSLDDRRLLRRIAAQDRAAFEVLYHRYYRRLFGYVFKITRRAELVEEIVNDVLLVVWQTAGRFEGRSQPSSWILGIAYRRALKSLARQRRGEDDALDPQWSSPEAGPERSTARREEASALGRALEALSPEQRAVVELTYFHGLAYREIAEVLSCPENTVKTRMFHARRRLRQLLPDLGISSGA